MNNKNILPTTSGTNLCRKLLLTAAALWLTIFQASAQEQETFKRGATQIESILPPSPEPAAAVKYVDVPFSHSQGLAELEVPVYTMQGRELSIPIAFKYNSGGIKLDEIAGVAGLGWNLSGGGCVTRTVIDMPDEFSSAIFEHSIPSVSLLSDLEAEVNNSETLGYLRKIIWHRVDSQLDRYSYNVCGLNGTFIIKDNGEVVQLSGDGSKISCDRASDNTINSFTIVGPDGIRYFLAEKETASHDGSSDHPFTPTSGEPDKWEATTAWHLSSITSRSGLETATFSYSDARTWKRSVYVRRDNINISKTSSSEDVARSTDYSFIANTYEVKALSSISLSGFTATFDYSTGTGNHQHYTSTGVSRENYPFMLRSVSISSPGNADLMSVNVGTEKHSTDGRIILNSLRIYRGGELDDRWDFSYDDVSNTVSHFSQDWFGYYNGEDDASPHTRGSLCPYSFSTNFNSITLTSGHPDAGKATYMSLLSSNHDGAKTSFIYEGNRIIYSWGDTLDIGIRVKSITVSEGLITAHVRRFTYENPVVDGHGMPNPAYYTTTNASLSLGGSTLPVPGHVWNISIHESPVTDGPSICDARVLYGKVTEDISGFQLLNSLDRRLPGRTGPVARIVRYYSMSGMRFGDRSTIHRFPSRWQQDYSSAASTPSSIDPWTGIRSGYQDNGPAGTALLTRQEEYSSNNGIEFTLLASTDWTYSPREWDDVLVGYRAFQVMQRLEQGNLQFEDLYHYPIYAATLQGGYPISSHTVEYHESGNEECTVNVTYTASSDLSVPVRKASVSSTTGGVTRTMSYTYPDTWGLTSFAPILCSQHALTIPLCREYRIYQGESPETAYKKEETRFEWFNIDGTNRLLPKSRTEFTDGVKSWEETILSRDCLGNISSIKETGKPLTSIIWSWSGRYPAAIVKNAGIEVVAAAVGTQSDLDSLARNPLPDNHTLARIITGLSDSLLSETHTTTYTFVPGIGLSSVTVPSGMTTIYEYDNAGRLSAVKDGDGRKLEGYIYNLLNSGNNRLSMRSRTFRDTTGVSYSENVKWWNTLGLATQDISIAGAGDGRDLVTAYSHDFLFHDDAMIWLPYPESGTSGDFQTSASSSAKAYHSNDLAYFQKTYEKSSRDKILAESLPGYAGTHQTVYATDVAAGFPYTIWSDSGLIANGTYNSSDVARDIVTDADGRVRSTYRDLAGRTLGISSGNEQPTLYIYDESDRLKAVVGSGTELTDTLDMWRYGYDNRGRLKSKGVPGSVREFYEYDEEDRIIRRSRGQESVEYEYDDFGRVLKKYLVHTSSSGGRMLIEENCYDRYYPSADSLLFLADGAINYGPSKGLLTSSRLAETGPSGEISGFVHRVILYDRKERPVSTVTSWPDGTILKENLIYTFSGEIASSSAELIHGNVTDMMTESFNYDIRGRKTASSSALSSDDLLTACADVQYHYDILGKPSGNDISVNGTQILSSADSLAMQGWTVSREIKAAQTPVFSESLIYDGESSLAGVPSSFTGLITEKDETWFGQDGSIGQGRKEGFVYNHAGMLVRVCSETGNANYSYDARGNILSTGGQLDSCLFHYSGDRITDVFTSEGTQAFFAHDIYGRMTSDGVSGISIAYNFMDLPSSVSDSIGILVEYSYLADGSKTGALREDGTGLIYRGPFVYRRSASGDLELESVAFGHGRLTPDGLLLHITDHLGNVRAVLDASDGTIYEKADYSAYGDRSSLISDAPQGIPAGTTLRYRFTGKEDQGPDFNVPYTDFGARMYSPTLCRWLTPDPLSEKYYGISPYVYCAGNPVLYKDDGGLDLVLVGVNNSSVTFKTGLVDMSVNIGALGVDWKGNYSLEGDELVSAALDIAGIFDPSGIADILNAGMQFASGNKWDAVVSVLGMVPGVGDLAKITRVGKEVNAIKTAIESTTYTKNLRSNLVKLTGKNPAGMDAHHKFPQKFKKLFENNNININDPKHGVWLDLHLHRKHAKEYNAEWGPFFEKHPTFTEKEAESCADELMKTVYKYEQE